LPGSDLIGSILILCSMCCWFWS